jgi:hypothetical protein
MSVCNSVALRSHCEIPLRICVKFIQSSDAATPKQSHYAVMDDKRFSKVLQELFIANSAQGDCFVASFLQLLVNVNFLLIFATNASRNDEEERNAGFTTQPQHFGMLHIESVQV